jgi:hypothetical protein
MTNMHVRTDHCCCCRKVPGSYRYRDSSYLAHGVGTCQVKKLAKLEKKRFCINLTAKADTISLE